MIENMHIAHRKWLHAFQKAGVALRHNRTKEKCVLICGPSRVGKGHLAERLAEELEREEKRIVVIKSFSEDASNSKLKSFFFALAEAVGVINPKQSSPAALNRRKAMKRLDLNEVDYLFIDEGDFLASYKAVSAMENSADTIKSMINETNAKICIIGTGKILKLFNSYAQLRNRAQKIYVEPYYLDCEKDRVSFTKIFRNIEENLKVPLSSELSKDVRFFFNRSMGCVGKLIEMLVECEELALDAGVNNMTRKLICDNTDNSAKDSNTCTEIQLVRTAVAKRYDNSSNK